MHTSVSEVGNSHTPSVWDDGKRTTREQSTTRGHARCDSKCRGKNIGRGVRQQSGTFCNLRYGEIQNVWGYDPNGAITNGKWLPESLGPVGTVKRAVLDSFAEMFGFDGIRGVEIGDGAGDFEDAVVGASGEAEASDGVFQKFFTVGGDGTLFADEARGHLGVGVGFLFGRETSGLAIARGDDARADGCGIFARGRCAEFFVFYGGDLDVDVNAVEERAGNFCDVALD